MRDTGSIPGLGGPPGEGSGNPLQYSCLENPMHRGAWRVTVHGVAKSWTRMKQLSTSLSKVFCFGQQILWSSKLSEMCKVYIWLRSEIGRQRGWGVSSLVFLSRFQSISILGKRETGEALALPGTLFLGTLIKLLLVGNLREHSSPQLPFKDCSWWFIWIVRISSERGAQCLNTFFTHINFFLN